MSSPKVQALLALNAAEARGDLCPTRLRALTPRPVPRTCAGFWGIGPWTGDMAAIFYFQEPDIWPDRDAAANKALRRLLREGQSLAEAAARFAPTARSWRCICGGVGRGALKDGRRNLRRLDKGLRFRLIPWCDSIFPAPMATVLTVQGGRPWFRPLRGTWVSRGGDDRDLSERRELARNRQRFYTLTVSPDSVWFMDAHSGMGAESDIPARSGKPGSKPKPPPSRQA